MKQFVLFFSLTILSVPLIGQKVSLKNAVPDGDNIIITYDLTDSIPGQIFRIDIYRIQNGNSILLKEASGDVGDNVKGGMNKKITWEAKKEITGIKGNIEFGISAKLTYSPVIDLNFNNGKKIRRGKTYRVTWRGGIENQPVNFELLRKGRLIFAANNQSNSGKTSLRIPKNIKAGGQYRLRITDAIDPNNKTETGEFSVLRRSPLGLKILGFAVIGGATAYYFISENNNPDNNSGIDLLPAAPGKP